MALDISGDIDSIKTLLGTTYPVNTNPVYFDENSPCYVVTFDGLVPGQPLRSSARYMVHCVGGHAGNNTAPEACYTLLETALQPVRNCGHNTEVTGIMLQDFNENVYWTIGISFTFVS